MIFASLLLPFDRFTSFLTSFHLVFPLFDPPRSIFVIFLFLLALPYVNFRSHLLLLRARSGICRRQLDPLRARRRPRRVGICVVVLSACTLFACLPSAFFLSFFVFIYALYLFILLICMCFGASGRFPLWAF